MLTVTVRGLSLDRQIHRNCTKLPVHDSKQNIYSRQNLNTISYSFLRWRKLYV